MPNRLIHASSPYLLQHAHNPVDWYPWGEEALEKAQSEDKLLIISIGYSACHWCHVMEHESFEDEGVAEVMNRHFVSIKVDREERPDIDKTYIEAVQLMTGQGGWPLNCVALPNGKPIWGGTYFPKDRWISALNQLSKYYKDQKQEALASAQNVQDYMLKVGKVIKVSTDSPFSEAHLSELLNGWMERIDFKWGGRKVSSNKFPVPVNYQFLIKAASLSKDTTTQEAVDISLEKMAFGGIYDHLGGGFARYSVDPYWKVPHFEKMLYDNGQLVSLYAEAYRQHPKKLYKQVVYDSLSFIERELTSPEGGFYSALDADSEGEEGKYYTWSHEEITSILGDEAKQFAAYYNVHPFGNWEGKNVLFVLETEEDFAKQWKIEVEEFESKMKAGRAKLLKEREKRIKPGLDDKILCSWNALMLKGYLDAYRSFDEPTFLHAAQKNADFLLSNLFIDGKLFRTYKSGRASIPAFLDDYAFLIDSLLYLYGLSFDAQWIYKADQLMKVVLEHFHDPQSGMFFYTSDESKVLVKRHIEIQDDVIPGSNSKLAGGLQQLGTLLQKTEYLELARQMIANAKSAFLNSPDWHANWGVLMLGQMYPLYEVTLTGPGIEALRKELDSRYYPLVMFAGGEMPNPNPVPILQDRFQDSATLYVCRENVCQLPVKTVADAWTQMGMED